MRRCTRSAIAEKLAHRTIWHVVREGQLEQLVSSSTVTSPARWKPDKQSSSRAKSRPRLQKSPSTPHLGESLLRNDELPRAYACFQQSTALCEEIAEERLRTHNRSFLAYLDSVTDHDGAYAALGESATYAHAHNYSWDEVNARYLLAMLYQKRGRTTEARAEFERCRELSHSVGFRLIDEDCRVALAELAS